MTRWLVTVVTGAAIYLVMVGRADGWSVAQGALAAAGARALVRRRPGEERAWRDSRSWRVLARLAAGTARQVIEGSVRVGGAAVGLRPMPPSTLVELPLGERPRVHPGALALLETFSPGAYLVDVDRERHRLIFHVFDAAEREELRERNALAAGAWEGGEEGGDEGGGGQGRKEEHR